MELNSRGNDDLNILDVRTRCCHEILMHVKLELRDDVLLMHTARRFVRANTLLHCWEKNH
jgi:hypothetical protein